MSPTRSIRTVMTLLAGLLAAPTFLIAGSAGPAAAQAPPEAPQPGDPPVLCVNDVERQFNSLKHHPEALGFHLGAGAYDPTSGRHYQGINRLPGEGPPRFIASRNGNVGDFELPGNEDQPGEAVIVELGSRDTNGERVRSNRLVANQLTQFTTPPAEDKVILSLKFGGEGPFLSWAFRHLGGMQTWGDIAILGMDRPFNNRTDTGHIMLLNLHDLSDPHVIRSFSFDHQASSIGVAPFGADRLLLITTGHNGSPIYGYEFMRNGKPTRNLRNDVAHPVYLRPVFEYDAANKNVGWPTGFQSLQTTNLFTDCGTGEMYLMGGYNLAPFENSSRDRIGMWKIDPLTGTLTPSSKRQIWCEWDRIDRLCNMAAGSGFYVSPSGDLIMYGITHDNDGPGGTVAMSEFTSRDGYDQDGAYRPIAVPGTYKGAPGSPITLDGTASKPAVAQGRVELYDEPNFGGRGLVIDYPDHGKEDYLHLSRVDGFNDEASSVRWRLPSRCDAVLYDDKDYKGPKRTLEGGDGSAKNIANLQSFNDDTSSVQFYGDCDGRIVSWKWDLGNDGTVDATGPKPTVTPPGPGIHPIALEVCSGFGVCHKEVGSLDASAGRPPKTTAVVNGTAGSNGWHRSTVNIVLTATGDPTPTEIRYSATGADPMAERTVAGTTATVVVDAQGETTVTYRAVNAEGHEAPQTVTVKVDTVAPAMVIRAPMEGGRYVTGSQVTIQVDCTDATSGVASCPQDDTPLDTAGSGGRTLTATATDAAGNTSTKPVNYTLVPAPAVNAELVYVARSDASPGPIHKSNSDGSNLVQLAEKGNDPVFSPDGTKVAYVELPVGGGRQIVVVNADGSGKVQLTNSATWLASNPAWSPDGSRIVYNATWTEAPSPTERITHRALMSVPSTGGPSTTLAASDEVDFSDPVYTRNGANITFVAGSTLRSIPAAGVPAGQLGTVLFGGLAGYHNAADPAWSPDGSTLVFQLWERETSAADLYAWNGTGNPVNLTGTQTAWPLEESPDAPREAGPTFLPDGRIVFVQDGDIWMMAAEPGAQKVLLADLPFAVRDVDAKGA
ncbi:MAG: PKD domain-containing protein [Actinomycetota bacterium]|nr:PKD domain-containing protein [Actinomycetota bacterium]